MQTLYFVDFLVPNEGDPESAIEIGILSLMDGESRPRVYLHSFIKPHSLGYIRWSNATQMGVSRSLVESQATVSLEDLKAKDFLKDKHIVCFNASQEPVKYFVRNCRSVISLNDYWEEAFHDHEETQKLKSVEEMMAYLGFDVVDNSGARYTPLLQRLHRMIALYDYLDPIIQNPKSRDKYFNSLPMSQYWPIPTIEETSIFENHQDFSTVEPESIDSLFSMNLPDYLNWNDIAIFDRSWVLDPKTVIGISELKERIPMAEYIFKHVLRYHMRLWVLIFYSLYEKKMDSACTIAHKNGNFNELPAFIREDFSNFIIARLDNFLEHEQKLQILSQMMQHSLSELSKNSFQQIDFDNYKRVHLNEKYSNITFNEVAASANCSVKVLKEIFSNDSIMYRRYEISGNEQDRNCCVNFINAHFKRFFQECNNPFSNFYRNSDLEPWLLYLLGYSYEELSREPHSSDNKDLVMVRSEYREIMDRVKKPYTLELKKRLTDIINQLSHNTHHDYEDSFCFMGTSIEIVVSKNQGSLLRRMFGF